MRFLLEDLMHLEMFEGSIIIAGTRNINNRVGEISIIDQLSTPQEIKKDSMVYIPVPLEDMKRDEQDMFLEMLYERGAGAVCLKARYEERIPNQFVSMAESLGLPLILLPNTFDFSEAVDIFLSNIFCKNSEEFVHQDSLHLRYNDRYSRYGIKGVIQLLHELSGLPVGTLVNKQQYIFGVSEVVADLDLAEIWQQANSLELQPTAYTYDFQVRRWQSSENKTNIYLVRTSYKDIEGYIGVAPDYGDISDSDASLLGVTAYWLTLIHKKTYYALFQSLAEQRSFLKKLLKGNFNSWEEAAKEAKKLEWELPQELQVLTVDYHLEDVVGLLETVRGLFFGMDGRIPIVSEYKRRIIILQPAGSGKIVEVARDVVERLRKKFNHSQFYAGIGGLVQFGQIDRSYQQSLEASRIAANLEQEVVLFKDMGVHRLFSHSLNNLEVRNFYSDYYLPLKEFDDKHDSELRRTLKCYLDSGCNYSETAKKMFLHYNTVRYRIGMIEKLCSVDMKTQDGLINIGVALKISELMDK